MLVQTGQSQFQANEPILLDNPSIFWVVHSGSTALFAARVQDGVVIGTRRYLFSLAEGQVICGGVYQEYQLFIVPIGEAQLVQYNIQSFSELIANQNDLAISWTENCLQQFGNIISESTLQVPKLVNSWVKPSQQSQFSLNSGEIIQISEDRIYWIKIKQGTVRYLGCDELILTNSTQVFPICSSTWLEVVDEVQFSIVKTSELSKVDLIEGLAFVYEQLLHLVPLLNHLEALEESKRLELRQQLNNQMTTKALTELASPLNSQIEDFVDQNESLLVAAGAVGKAMGVKICPTLNSEDLQQLKEPLEAIARASRLRIRRVVLRDNWWENDCGPLVAYAINDNTSDDENSIFCSQRPVALLPVSAGNYELFDPIEQKRQRVTESVAENLAPFAYVFYRSLPDKVITIWDLLRFAFKGKQTDILMILFTGVGVMLLGMLTPIATGIIISNAIPNQDTSLLIQLGLGLFVATFAAALLQVAQGFAILRIEASTDVTTQSAVWDRLLKEPVSFFRKYTIGDLQSRVFAISAIRRQLSGRVIVNLISSFFSLFFFGQLVYYSWFIALIAAGVALITFVLTTFFGVILFDKSRPILECEGELFGQTVQLINGISKLHIAGAQERAFASWCKNYTRQTKLENEKKKVEEIMTVFNTVMPTFTNVILFLFVVNLFSTTETGLEANAQTAAVGFTLGAFIAFNTAFGNFIQGITELSNTFTEILQIVPLWKRTKPILNTIPEVNIKKADPGKLTGKITIERVTFSYRKDGVPTLNNVSISAQPGEFIALIGGSGSGKSTLLRLLLGFETYESGSIYYDNQNLSGLDIDAVRRQMGVVLQTTQLQSASIYENIAGGASITLEEAWEAAKASGFADDIMAMPMQMHTVISEGGSNLSGGQRQRLVIARALALKPRILLFDEATSALDNKTQAIVSEHLDQLNVTRIVIAHRLSTIRNAQRIYVMEAGQVVQQGTYDELSSQPGLFARLMARQNL
ncbi:MAG: NHLP bacteriocin export ABC transporter permease/ATPase subunit [Richelia sp. RM1_1_1]|nr:NHLP bacteriocin export ABC transporter permease/ATPase subunit [Richelia sp. RM1_1_1]